MKKNLAMGQDYSPIIVISLLHVHTNRPMKWKSGSINRISKQDSVSDRGQISHH